MSFREVGQEGAYSIGIAPQTALNEEGASYEWIECALFEADPEATQVDTPRGHQQYGADQAPLPGKEWNRLVLKGPVTGQLGAYNATSDTPDVKGLSRFLAFIGASSTIAYQLDGINPNDANEISLVTSTGKYGCLILGNVSGDSTLARPLGFVKTLSGGGPYACTLFEDMFTQPENTDERLPTRTFYPSAYTGSTVAFSVRVTHDDAGQNTRHIGCVPTSVVLRVEDDRLMWEVSVIQLSKTLEDEQGDSGGLQAMTSILAMSPATEGSYHPFNGVHCGAEDVVLRIDWGDPIITPGPYSQGAYQVTMRRPTVTAEVTIPKVSDFSDADGYHDLLTAWRTRTPVSLTGYHGIAAGRVLAWGLRSAHLSSISRERMVRGRKCVVATLRAGAYTGDTASTDAGNKPFVIAVG